MTSRIRNLAFAFLALTAVTGVASISSSTVAEARGFHGGGIYRGGFHGGFRFGGGVFHRPHFWGGHRWHGYGYGYGWRRPFFLRNTYVAVVPSCYVVTRVNPVGLIVRVPVCR